MRVVKIVRLRSRPDGFFYVSLMPVLEEEKPKTVFKSNDETTARNVARQFAKQFKCMMAFEFDVIENLTLEDEDDDPGPQEAL